MSVLDTLNKRLRTGVQKWLFPGWGPMEITFDEKKAKKRKLILTARKYYDGEQEIKMTERQKKYLALHTDAGVVFTVNHCATVVDAVIERMRIVSFKVTSAAASLEPPKVLSEEELAEDSEIDPLVVIENLIWLWVKQNRLDAMQIETHRQMVRDGETFVLVDYDEEKGVPRMVLHQRFVAVESGGDGFGMWVVYPNEDPLRKPIKAVKQWRDYDEQGAYVDKRVSYFKDKIVREKAEGGVWVPREEDDKPAEEPWELGIIPVAHYPNPGLKSELADVIPVQDAFNKTWLDILAAADTTAFRMLVFLGWIPTTDGEDPEEDGANLLEIMPGQNIATAKDPETVKFDTVEPADLSPLLSVEERLVFRMATISDTPAYRFQTSKQIAGSETQKQMDGPLIAKVETRQILAGNAWEDVMLIALKLANKYSSDVTIADIDDLMINTVWRSAEVRDDKEVMDISKGKKDLKVPLETLWKELGYSADEIAQFKKSPEYQAMLAMREAALLMAGGEDKETGSDDEDEGGEE